MVIRYSLRFPLASYSSAKAASSLQNRPLSTSWPKGMRHHRSSGFSALRSDGVDNDGALVVLYNRNYSSDEDFL